MRRLINFLLQHDEDAKNDFATEGDHIVSIQGCEILCEHKKPEHETYFKKSKYGMFGLKLLVREMTRILINVQTSDKILTQFLMHTRMYFQEHLPEAYI